MVDYSKFDNIADCDSDDEADPKSVKSVPSSAADKGENSGGKKGVTKKGAEGRLKFEHDGNTIYEWEETLEEVNIYIMPPPGLERSMIVVEISHLHLCVGIKDSAPFIDEDTGGPVKTKESYWTLCDGEMVINLQKMNKAEAWNCALRGNAGEEIDEVTKEDIKKKLMLERFQEEVRHLLMKSNRWTMSDSFFLCDIPPLSSIHPSTSRVLSSME